MTRIFPQPEPTSREARPLSVFGRALLQAAAFGPMSPPAAPCDPAAGETLVRTFDHTGVVWKPLSYWGTPVTRGEVEPAPVALTDEEAEWSRIALSRAKAAREAYLMGRAA